MKTKLTQNQLRALGNIAEGLSGAQFDAVHPVIRRSLYKRGLIKKDWLNPHNYGNVEYLKLTEAGREVGRELLGWE